MLNPRTWRGKVNGSQKSFLRSTRIWTGNESISVCCLCILLKVDREEKKNGQSPGVSLCFKTDWKLGNILEKDEKIKPGKTRKCLISV